MPATIRDVARYAGCSIKTVSRVINNEPFVTEETRAKVLAAVRAVGYAPNISARRLAENKSYMICILMVPGLFQFAADTILPIIDIGYQEGYDIQIQTFDPSNTLSRQKLVTLIYEHRADGFIITPPLDFDGFIEDMLATYKVPHVLINPKHGMESSLCVQGEDFQGAYSMTVYLLKLGHKRIAFIGGPADLRSSAERLNGYLEALREHGAAHQAALIRSSNWTFEAGYTQAKELLQLADRPTAIFAGSDQAAYGVIYAAQQAGMEVPRELSICGFDGLAMSDAIWPGLTTVHQPIGSLIEVAAHRLIDFLKGQPVENLVHVVPSQLVIRGSTAPPG